MKNTDQDIWRVWASNLQQWGITNLVASLLEAAGPLTILGAQIVYLCQPVLDHSIPDGHLSALARLLEDSTRTRDFVAFIQEAAASESI
jgi:hypothetical protein